MLADFVTLLDMFVLLAGRIVQVLITLATVKLATTWLSPEEMGRLALLTSTISFFALFLVNPVGMFIWRRFQGWLAAGLLMRYLKYYAVFLLIVGLLAVLTLTASNTIYDFSARLSLRWLLALTAFSLLFTTLNQTFFPALNMMKMRLAFVVGTCATLLASLIAALALCASWGAHAEYWYFGILLGQALLATLGFFLLNRESVRYQAASKQSAEDWKQSLGDCIRLRNLWQFCWPIALAVGLAWLQQQSYRFFLEDRLGLAELGLFAAGYGLAANFMASAEGVLTSFFQPKFYQAVESQGPEAAWREYAGLMLPPLLLASAWLLACAPVLLRLLLGPSFHNAIFPVYWGAIAEFARAMNGVFGLRAHGEMQTRRLLWPTFMGALAVVLALPLALPALQAHGAGLAINLGSWLTLFLFFWQSPARPSARFYLQRGVDVACCLGAVASGLWLWPKLATSPLPQQLLVLLVPTALVVWRLRPMLYQRYAQ